MKKKVPPEAMKYFVEVGRIGGLTRAKHLTQTERSESAQKASKTRWAGMNKEERSLLGRKAAQARWSKQRGRKP